MEYTREDNIEFLKRICTSKQCDICPFKGNCRSEFGSFKKNKLEDKSDKELETACKYVILEVKSKFKNSPELYDRDYIYHKSRILTDMESLKLWIDENVLELKEKNVNKFHNLVLKIITNQNEE